MTGRRCPFGDPYCPCQDGDCCHYVDTPGSPAMPRPAAFWDFTVTETEREPDPVVERLVQQFGRTR